MIFKGSDNMLIRIYLFLILILEIASMVIAKKSKNKKYFKISNGLFWGFFISIFLYCIYFLSDLYSYDTGEWVQLTELIISAFFCIINLILGLISLIFQIISKKKNNFSNTSQKGTTIKYIFIVIIISFIIILSQYLIRYKEKNIIENDVKQETMIYLKEKYGTDNFEILDIDRDFAANGWIETDYLENYEIEVIYIPDKIKFFINLDVDGTRKVIRKSSNDTLISRYFDIYFTDDDFKNDGNNAKEKLSNYLKTKELNVDVLLDNYFYDLTARDVLSNDYGKIPTKTELYNIILDYHLKHEFEIKINEDEIKSNDIESELRVYLITLSNYLIDYYNKLDDFEIYCSYDGGKGKYFRGTIRINKEYINIDVGSIEEKISK